MLRGKLISAFASAILSAVVAYADSPAAASEMQVESSSIRSSMSDLSWSRMSRVSWRASSPVR